MKKLQEELFKIEKKGKFTKITGLKEKFSATILTSKFDKEFEIVKTEKKSPKKDDGVK